MKKWQKSVLGLGLLTLLCFIFSGCGNSAEKEVKINKEPYSDNQFLMGTYVNLKIYDDGKKEVLDKAFKKIKVLADKITVNEAGSEIDKVNAQAGIAPVKVSDDIYRLVKAAYKYSVETDGGFDMAIGPITQLWHIGFDDARKPSQEEIDAALKLVDYRKITLDDKKKTVYLEEKGMQLDLGGVAKGFITDEVVKLLKKNDVTTAIVDLGGNVYVLGKSPNSGNNWTIGVQDPNQARFVSLGTLKEKNVSLVTSGIYERKLVVDGVTYHHIMDPKTGYPFDNDIASVSIVSKKSVEGDGLFTKAVFSKGIKAGMTYIEKQKGVEAIIVSKEGKIYVSSGLKNNFKITEDNDYKMGNIADLN